MRRAPLVAHIELAEALARRACERRAEARRDGEDLAVRERSAEAADALGQADRLGLERPRLDARDEAERVLGGSRGRGLVADREGLDRAHGRWSSLVGMRSP